MKNEKVYICLCQAEGGMRELVRSGGLGDVVKRQVFRRAGAEEADTRARLAGLISAGRPDPGAATKTRGIETPDPWDRGPELSSELPWDAWTVPDDLAHLSFDLKTEDDLIDIPGVTRTVPPSAKSKSRSSKPKSPAPKSGQKPARKGRKATGGAT